MFMPLTSCVGLGVMKGERKEHATFAINETRSKPMRRLVESDGGRNPTRKEIESCWGSPNKKSEVSGEELWSYDRGLSVRGAVPMLGIGIPLLAPVGKNSFDFHFSSGGERACKLVVNKNRMWGGYFGVSAFSETRKFGFHKFDN